MCLNSTKEILPRFKEFSGRLAPFSIKQYMNRQKVSWLMSISAFFCYNFDQNFLSELLLLLLLRLVPYTFTSTTLFFEAALASTLGTDFNSFFDFLRFVWYYFYDGFDFSDSSILYFPKEKILPFLSTSADFLKISLQLRRLLKL